MLMHVKYQRIYIYICMIRQSTVIKLLFCIAIILKVVREKDTFKTKVLTFCYICYSLDQC